MKTGVYVMKASGDVFIWFSCDWSKVYSIVCYEDMPYDVILKDSTIIDRYKRQSIYIREYS